MKVGIAGITGKFARRLLTHLLDAGDDSLTIKGYCLDPSKVPDALKSSSKLQLIRGTAFDKETIATFVKGCDVVVCCYLGDDTLKMDGQTLLINACQSANVPRYVASDWALDYTKLKPGELFPKNLMIHVKAYLETKESVAGIMKGTTYDDAAKYTSKAVLDSTAKGVLKFLGGRATIQEIAKSYEAVYGVPVKLEQRGYLDDLYRTMRDLRAKNPQDIYSYMSFWPRDRIGTSFFAMNM
ncbi:hypothetical protein BJX68DRAFT_255339 [Aspergillus pseudodeflectus]|uniref:NAD(P)-binding domain-containing protein n=1 Tax=Aspergillus pseudodeflectus TaxID=176178 RepID=A0ABR4KCX4_9EURO